MPHIPHSANHLERLNIMEWFPIVAGTFKVLVLGTGMYFAIKWHYDKDKAEKEKKRISEAGAQQAPAEYPLNASDKPADIQ